MRYGTREETVRMLSPGDLAYTARIKRCEVVLDNDVPILTSSDDAGSELYISDYYSSPEEVFAVHSNRERAPKLLEAVGAKDYEAVELAVIECALDWSGSTLVFVQFVLSDTIYWYKNPEGGYEATRQLDTLPLKLNLFEVAGRMAESEEEAEAGEDALEGGAVEPDDGSGLVPEEEPDGESEPASGQVSDAGDEPSECEPLSESDDEAEEAAEVDDGGSDVDAEDVRQAGELVLGD